MKLLHSTDHTSHQFRRDSMVDHLKESNCTRGGTKLLFMKLLHSTDHTSHQFRRDSMVDHLKESNCTRGGTKLFNHGGAGVVDGGEVDCGDFRLGEI
ncbi:hypothetical protein MtrunA17_Chr1g0161091 [Medicago truncatula]|uniref:Uncharacterized protein n=1 Tax=Medicago truncatula TaxID=3880 RepID=A0A396JIF0_MEDTR|nr:hypothetical protein MtrunA17_Chr1g0161091 [Medicago truncatula]